MVARIEERKIINYLFNIEEDRDLEINERKVCLIDKSFFIPKWAVAVHLIKYTIKHLDKVEIVVPKLSVCYNEDMLEIYKCLRDTNRLKNMSEEVLSFTDNHQFFYDAGADKRVAKLFTVLKKNFFSGNHIKSGSTFENFTNTIKEVVLEEKETGSLSISTALFEKAAKEIDEMPAIPLTYVDGIYCIRNIEDNVRSSSYTFSAVDVLLRLKDKDENIFYLNPITGCKSLSVQDAENKGFIRRGTWFFIQGYLTNEKLQDKSGYLPNGDFGKMPVYPKGKYSYDGVIYYAWDYLK